jgi:hypothetical protein
MGATILITAACHDGADLDDGPGDRPASDLGPPNQADAAVPLPALDASVSPSPFTLDASPDGTGSHSQPRDAGADAAALRPVVLGVNAALGAGSDSVGLTPSERTLVDLEVLALGVDATTVEFRWNGLETLDQALQRARIYADAGVRVLFSVDIVRARRPLAVFDDALAGELEHVVDEIYASGVPLAALSLGEALDVHLAELNGERRGQFARLVSGFLTYASESGQRPEDLRVAFHSTERGWEDPPEEFTQWQAASDAFALSWFALDADGSAVVATSGGPLFGQIIDRMSPVGNPVFVREVAYPSATIVLGSDSRQLRFYEQVLPALSVRAERVPMLAVSALDNPAEEECEMYAEDFGLAPGAALARCSVGLREPSGEPKPAYYAIVDAMAAVGAP